jgi:hypothetical protein
MATGLRFSASRDRLARDSTWICHADYPMSNGDHPVLQTPDANLFKDMRQLNGVDPRWPNRGA